VLFTGRLVAYKGCDVLLRALEHIHADAIFAGDGPLRGELTALSEALGVSNRVWFRGDVSPEHLLALYHAADVFVLPSVTRAEAFGFVQVEAMACGTPVISTNLPTGVPWVNQHRITGMVVEPGDVQALRDALTSLLLDPTTRDRMGAAARLRVEQEFTLRQMGERATALYKELV
jgi:rhamnosyl/mannosyltransferase